MISFDRANSFRAASAALFLFPLFLAAPAAADPAAALRAAIEDARREAQVLRRDVELAQVSPDAAVQLNRRLDALERLIQNLTNKIDSLDVQQRELAREFERYKNDTDFRLGQIDKGTRAPARPASPPERRAEPPPERRPAPPTRSQADEDSAPPPRLARRGEEPPNTDADAGRSLPGGSPRDQYEHALGLLRRADYKAAEAALRDFVRRHPNDALAANAYYWLGENYYAQGRYQDAAYQFADGFRKFPSHPKAQDSLFKLALSFARQGKTTEACASFAEYRKRFPNAGLRREAEAEQRRMNCPT
jgi:tol-pal system protein YbgF